MELSTKVIWQGPLLENDAAVALARFAQYNVERAAICVKGNIVVLTPSNTHVLRSSIQLEIAPLVATIYSPSPYAVPVEVGQRPHWPPIAPMALWAIRRFSVSDQAQLHSIVYFVSRKIARSGVKGFEMFRMGVALATKSVEAIFQDMGAQIALYFSS